MDSTDAVKYIWVDVEVMGPTYVIGIEATLKAAGIVVDDRKDWLILQWPRRREYAYILNIMRVRPQF